MRETFKQHRFNASSRALLKDIETVLTEYARQDFCLTVRQVYYIFITRDLFPETWIDPEYNRKHNLPLDAKNTVKNYKRFGTLIGQGRLAGEIDWAMFEDRTRVPKRNSHWNSPADILSACAEQYITDKWRAQGWYVEVMIEKEALAGIIQPVCAELDVAFSANKGYSSLSAMYEASKRYYRALKDGKDVEVIYLGDHDPSGLDMTRDIGDRLETFLAPVKIQRLALNMDQIEQYRPPPNPAKTSDSRYAVYVAEFGEQSWELDALEPSVLQTLVRNEILRLRDKKAWDAAVREEQAGRKKLGKLAKTLED